MPNIVNQHNLSEQKNNSSFPEIESFYDLPEGNPLMIVDAGCKIIFSNSEFRKTFNLSEAQSFFELKSEPDLGYLLLAFSGTEYNNFHFDLFLSTEYNINNNNYSVDVERVFIERRKYFIIVFKCIEEKTDLEERINNLHNALEYGRVPVIITDADGKISYATNSFEEILKTGIDNIYGNFLPDVLSFYLTIAEKHQLEDCIHELKGWTKTISVSNDDGVIHYLELKLNPIFRAGEDNLSLILTANDITNLILKNQVIKKSERRLKSIINNISDLLFIFKEKDNELTFENANENFCRIFLIDKTKLFKKPINLILETELLELITVSIRKFEQPEDSYIEFNYRDIGDREYSVKITQIDDKVEQEKIFIVSMKDVTDQILYQEQLKRAYEKEMNLNKLKTAFMENMSHEIRTPFNALAGYSEIIEECVIEKDYNTILDLVQAFKDVLQRVLNLFTNIVEVSEIESGDVELEIVELNCNQVLKSVYNNMKEEAEKKKLSFNLNMENDELRIRTDWMKLERIISSLIHNALKYTDYGNVAIYSRLHNNEAEITISDTGKGMDPAQIKLLVEPFVQEEEAYVRNYEGAGLGLTVANRLTNILGGKFDIISTKNKGTTIILTFPSITEANKANY